MSLDAEDKVRRRTAWSRMSVGTIDGFLVGLDTSALGIAQGKNNDVVE